MVKTNDSRGHPPAAGNNDESVPVFGRLHAKDFGTTRPAVSFAAVIDGQDLYFGG